ncbi:GNAT family N-acetyltransferase [Actinoplanes sp. DH11]|uniref:GNAT family N-acetyltransferase n=1 Tax=Actinoplanes sp. DH11 TaxID=2857011 RepID=UPI001E4F7928|nr:GNAT family N-acetyltransferase [Actinoplanes sp. DH11]
MDQDEVLLRECRPEDAPKIAEGEADPAFRRFLGGRRSGGAHVERRVIANEATGEFLGMITKRTITTGIITAGMITAKMITEETITPGVITTEVTFWVLPAHRRRGTATAALRKMRGERLEMLIDADNPVAQRAALAAGFTREGVRRLPGGEVQAWSRLAGDRLEPAPRLLPDLPGGELSDGVVTLRPLGEQDVAFYAELHSLPEVVNTSVPPVPPTPEEVHRRCFHSDANWLAGNRADMIILDAVTGAAAGEIALHYQEPPTGQAMIGYSMLPAHRGRGFATRAAQLVGLWAFAETDVARLIAGAAPDNIGSQRVLEKAGFRREAFLRSRLPGPGGVRIDDVQYVLLAGDLLAQASSDA